VGKLVNVVLPSGRVVSVPEEESAGLPGADASEIAETGRADINAARSSGVIETAKSAGEGLLDTLTFGGYGKAREMRSEQLGDSDVQDMRIRAQEHPVARFAGEMAGFVNPVGELGAPGLIGRAGEAVGGGVLGHAVEGALVGAGGHIASTNVTGDPLTIEGLVESAGVGGVLNVGAGMLASKLTGKAKRAQEAIDEAEQTAKNEQIAREKGKHFESDSGVSTAYNQFTDAVESRQASAAKDYAQWERANDKYQKWVSGNKTTGDAIDRAKNVVRSIRQRYGAVQEATQHPAFDVSDVDAEMGAQAQPGVKVEWVDGKPRGVMSGYDSAGNPSTVLTNAKPPISPKLDQELKDYSARISEILQTKGGRLRTRAGGAWDAAEASGPSNREAMMGQLRSLYNDLQRQFPDAASDLGDLPVAPGPAPAVPPKVELADNFRAFTRQHPETIAKIANSMDDATAAEFDRVTKELGAESRETPQDTITSVHRQAGEWMKAIDDLEAAGSESTRASQGLFALARRFARNSIRFKAGWMARSAIGGPIGTAAGVAASALIGSALERGEESLLSGTMVAAKDGLRQRISSVVARYGAPVASGIDSLGPVTAYLAGGHLGQKSSTTDIRKQARERIDEAHIAAITAPDTAYTAVEPLLGHPSDVAWKIHNQVTSAVKYVSATAPKDPGLDMKLLKSDWSPAYHAAIELAHTLEATFNPLASLARLLAGQGHPAAANTLWNTWPATMQEAAQQVVEKVAQGKYSYQRASAFSRVFRTPMTGFQNPVVITALQGQYLPKPAGSPTGGGGSSTRPTGRPPAVTSPVAGSNVSSLIS
jgi:hypothetical protein